VNLALLEADSSTAITYAIYAMSDRQSYLDSTGNRYPTPSNVLLVSIGFSGPELHYLALFAAMVRR